MNNIFYNYKGLPAFHLVNEKELFDALKLSIQNHKKTISVVLNSKRASWDSVVGKIENADNIVSKAWAPLRHLNSVTQNKKLRVKHEKALKLLTNYYGKISLSSDLYKIYKKLYEENKSKHSAVKNKVLENIIRDFELSGVHLAGKQKASFLKAKERLSLLEAKFENNVVDSSAMWSKSFKDSKPLKGLSEIDLQLCMDRARLKKTKGYVINLEQPCYNAVMTNAESRNLRKEMYKAFSSRASKHFPVANNYCNEDVIEEILLLRHQISKTLGFNNYAEYSIETKMVKGCDEVLSFLESIRLKAHAKAKLEIKELANFAKKELKINKLEPWDLAFVSEKYKKEFYGIDQDELKKYFPVENVISGMFSLVKKLYGLKIYPVKTRKVWHKDVKLYEIYDQGNNLRGKFYLDLYARPGKRSGAWMDECAQRKKAGNSIQCPVAFMTCNSPPPTADKPALFTHYDVETLFHEFGHGLHHMLTKVDYASISGISGVEWDAVELPSQFMENWCWEKEVLDTFAFHYETGEKIPTQLFNKLIKTKNFNTGLFNIRQIEFALFDFKLHMLEKNKNSIIAQKTLDNVRKKTSFMKIPKYNKFQNSFGHIFAGGYAAGYYSYKWAEVLSADAYKSFKSGRKINYHVGKKFMRSILEKGGSKPAGELFQDFKGRPPSVSALIKSLGL